MGQAVAPEVVSSCPARPVADAAMRRVLRIPDGGPTAGEGSAHRIFSASILLSALRCLFSYIVLPIVTPAVGAATGVGPIIGIPVAIVALVFDMRGIRRFWLADHRWRWAISGIYLVVMIMVSALLVADVVHLVR